jgi:hypothetical protein
MKKPFKLKKFGIVTPILHIQLISIYYRPVSNPVTYISGLQQVITKEIIIIYFFNVAKQYIFLHSQTVKLSPLANNTFFNVAKQYIFQHCPTIHFPTLPFNTFSNVAKQYIFQRCPTIHFPTLPNNTFFNVAIQYIFQRSQTIFSNVAKQYCGRRLLCGSAAEVLFHTLSNFKASFGTFAEVMRLDVWMGKRRNNS